MTAYFRPKRPCLSQLLTRTTPWSSHPSLHPPRSRPGSVRPVRARTTADGRTSPFLFLKLVIVHPVMEGVTQERETLEERGSFQTEGTGPPVGGLQLSKDPVTPAPCWANPVGWLCSNSVGLRHQHKLCFVAVYLLYALAP
jgi:hypothetical protein